MSLRAQDAEPADCWMSPADPPEGTGVYLTKSEDGTQLFRRYDRKGWHYGDKFARNVADSIVALKAKQRASLVTGWAIPKGGQ